jgi:hypothetical protein
MGVTVPRDATLRGLPFRVWKTLLTRWPGARDRVWDMARMPGIAMEPYRFVAMVDEAEYYGLLTGGGSSRHRRTERGDQYLRTRVGRRYPRAKAQALLDQILARVILINANPTMPFRIVTVVVFGSFADPERTDVGDLDLYITREYTGPWERVLPRYAELAGKHPYDHHVTWRYDAVEYREIFGPRKDPMIDYSGIADPAQYGFAHRCVYDARRGGPVDDAMVPENRNLESRRHLVERLDAVAFGDRPDRPVHARWFADLDRHDYSDHRQGPWVGTRGAYHLLKEARVALHWVSSPEDEIVQRYPQVAAHPAMREVNGRARIALVLTRTPRDASPDRQTEPLIAVFVITRQIETVGREALHTTRLVDLISGPLGDFTAETADDVSHAILLVAWALHALGTADAHLIAMRDADAGEGRTVQRRFVVDLPNDAAGFIVDRIWDQLAIYLDRDLERHDYDAPARSSVPSPERQEHA